MRRRIIFLDIDGVLNSVRYDRERGAEDGNMDESRVALLARLARESGAELVLSSTWRRHWGPTADECDGIGRELNATLARHGLVLSDKTPLLPRYDRPREIREWLERHGDEVASFVILDDEYGGWGELEPHLVKTDARIGRGLEVSHVERALELLRGQ